jgi:hypothetical protein
MKKSILQRFQFWAPLAVSTLSLVGLSYFEFFFVPRATKEIHPGVYGEMYGPTMALRYYLDLALLMVATACVIYWMKMGKRG